MKGLAIEGIIYYIHRVIWYKRGTPKPDSAKPKNFSWTSSFIPATGVSGVGPFVNIEGNVAASTQEPAHESPITCSIPEYVHEAMTFMKNATVPSGNRSVQDIISNHFRLVKASQIHAI